MNSFWEAVIIGIVTAVIGLIITYIFLEYTYRHEATYQNPAVIQATKFNHWWLLALALFITGFIVFYIVEYTDLKNKGINGMMAGPAPAVAYPVRY